MTEKTICSEYNETEQIQTTKIIIPDHFKREMKIVDILLRIITEHDENLINQLLPVYKKTLNKMNISSEKNKLNERFTLDYSEYKYLSKYLEIITLIENAVLYFLNFSKYEKSLSNDNEIEALMFDVIRGEFFPYYYLAFSLIDIVSRETTLEIAKNFTEFYYELIRDKIRKADTIEGYASSFFDGKCPKNQNHIMMVKDGKFYLKTTRCMWAEVYSELPDLELANLLECYGDFAKMPYLNPNFVMTRTKTLVEGHSCCDFVFHDKRTSKEIKHPDVEFWKNF